MRDIGNGVYTFGNDNLQANNCIVPFISVAALLISANIFTTATATNNSEYKFQSKINTNTKINEQAYYHNAYCPIVNSNEFQIPSMGNIQR